MTYLIYIYANLTLPAEALKVMLQSPWHEDSRSSQHCRSLRHRWPSMRNEVTSWNWNHEDSKTIDPLLPCAWSRLTKMPNAAACWWSNIKCSIEVAHDLIFVISLNMTQRQLGSVWCVRIRQELHICRISSRIPPLPHPALISGFTAFRKAATPAKRPPPPTQQNTASTSSYRRCEKSCEKLWEAVPDTTWFFSKERNHNHFASSHGDCFH